jgi:hypothetical protein
MDAIRDLENRLRTRILNEISAQANAREDMDAYFRETGKSQCNHK